jgi:hypothetical protein
MRAWTAVVKASVLRVLRFCDVCTGIARFFRFNMALGYASLPLSLSPTQP